MEIATVHMNAGLAYSFTMKVGHKEVVKNEFLPSCKAVNIKKKLIMSRLLKL